MQLAVTVVLLLAAFVCLWGVQRRTDNASWADAGWAAGIGVLSLAVLSGGSGDGARRAVAGALLLLWSGRLSLHLLARARHSQEDGRFADMRRRWGQRGQRNFLFYFVMQVPLVLLFALPAWVLADDIRPLQARDAAGASVALAGMAGTWLADRQLAHHRAVMPPDQVCQTGLWSWSRHPNYFFEWVFWCAWPLWAPLSPLGAVTALPAMALYFLLTRLTGIPPSERRALKTRPLAYAAYQQTTSAFFPTPPKTGNRA